MYARLLSSLLLVALFSIAGLAARGQQSPSQQPAATQQKPPSKTHLKVGDPAPDFTLRATDGKAYKLSDFKGKKNVVLAIYVLAFTGG